MYVFNIFYDCVLVKDFESRLAVYRCRCCHVFAVKKKTKIFGGTQKEKSEKNSTPERGEGQ